jgi:hypothetical protein
MAWSVQSCDSTTGAKIGGKIPTAAFPWERVLNSGGSGRAVFKLGDPSFDELDMRDLTDHVRRTLVLEWDGEPVAAGLVWKRTWDRDTQTLTVDHEDLWSILKRRFLVPQNTTGVAKAAPIVFSNVSVSTAVKKTLQAVTSDFPMAYWGDFTGSRKETYEAYLLKPAADALEDQIRQPDGPDLDLRPIYTEGRLQWQMRSNQEFGTYTWNLSAAQSGISGLQVIEDATNLSNNVFAVGQGTEADTLIRADTAPSPYPLLQSMEAGKDEDSIAKLDGIVAEGLRIHAKPTEQWSFSILASGGNGDIRDQTKVTDLRLNGLLSLHDQGDRWLPPGKTQHRLIRYSGDMREKIRLEFQPTGGS